MKLPAGSNPRHYNEVIDTLPEGYAIRKIGEATEEGDELWVGVEYGWSEWDCYPDAVIDGTIRYKIKTHDSWQGIIQDDVNINTLKSFVVDMAYVNLDVPDWIRVQARHILESKHIAND